jgi:hypothetical protein
MSRPHVHHRHPDPEPHEYRCAICGVERFTHPGVEDCETSEDGYCAHLRAAKWLPVQMRVVVATNGRCICYVGGWIGPACVVRYGAAAATARQRQREKRSL